MASTGPRVVCALWVTMATLAPTSALINVDLPLFGAPISATKPHRVSVAAWSVMLRSLPDALAQQHGERRRLLRRALVRAVPTLRGNAIDLHLGGKARLVVRSLAGDFDVAWQRQMPSLRPSLEDRFCVRRDEIEAAQLRGPTAMHHVARRLVAAVDEDRTEHRLAGICKDGLLRTPAALRLAAAHHDDLAKLPALSDIGTSLGAYQLIESSGELPFARLRKARGQELGDGEPEHAVAQKFEPLIILVRLERGPRARMRQLELDQRAIVKGIPDPFKEMFESRVAPLGQSSMHQLQNARPTNVGRPFPNLPEGGVLVDGEEDNLSATDQVIEGHVANLGEKAAVGRIIPVVAHHEEVPLGHSVHFGIVADAFVDEIEHGIGHPVRQGLYVARGVPLASRLVAHDEIVDALFLHRLAVDVQHAVNHLDLVAGQADHALDIVGLVVARQLEHDHVAALRLLGPDAPGEQIRPEGEGIPAIAVAVF